MVTKSLIGEIGVTRRAFRRDPSLVLWLPLYRLQGNTIYSEEGLRHLCTVFGALWTPQGRTFDGNDSIGVPAHASLDLTNALTIMGWVKPGTQTTAYAAMVSKQNHTGQANKGYFIDRNNVDASSYRFGFGTGTAYVVATNLLVLTNGVWQHFAITKTGTTMAIYVNGALVTSETVASATIATNTVGLYLGDWGDSGVNRRYWIGTEGEIFVANRALSAGDVTQYYLNTKWRYS